ncbi:hypothetical protein GCM10009828_096830 [Actinoplanes couchii]|uniref:Uncharacterized protein n=1 Tax=Actinoplanes couchii TaxID=403638 RepID=A0ABQ3XHK2_9ACTN|nr:hypothetical protein Aco03nite_063750 [Actinoplanes couchii]
MARFVTTTYPAVSPQERVARTSPAQNRIIYPPTAPDDADLPAEPALTSQPALPTAPPQQP